MDKNLRMFATKKAGLFQINLLICTLPVILFPRCGVLGLCNVKRRRFQLENTEDLPPNLNVACLMMSKVYIHTGSCPTQIIELPVV